jgi:hypothetical protein
LVLESHLLVGGFCPSILLILCSFLQFAQVSDSLMISDNIQCIHNYYLVSPPSNPYKYRERRNRNNQMKGIDLLLFLHSMAHVV